MNPQDNSLMIFATFSHLKPMYTSQEKANWSCDSVIRYRDRNQGIHGYLCGNTQEVCLAIAQCLCLFY